VPYNHQLLEITILGAPHSPYALTASLMGDGLEILIEAKCACPLDEKGDGRGWLWAPYKKVLHGKSINVRTMFNVRCRCLLQMLITASLLVGILKVAELY